MDADTKFDCLSFMNIVTEGNKGWFINECWNAIFEIDRSSFEPTYIDCPTVFLGNGAQYKWLAKWKERFVCISNLTNIPLYLIDGVEKHATFTLPAGNFSDSYMICSIIQKGKYLYLFTDNKYISVIEFDMETGKFEKILNWNDRVQNRQIPFKMGQVYCHNNSLWSNIIGTHYVIEITCDTFEIQIYEGVKNVCYEWAFEIKDNRYYALAGREETGCILVGELSKESCNIEVFEISKYIKKGNYDGLKAEGDTVWLLPKEDANIIKICLSTGEYKELHYPAGFFWKKDRRYRAGIRFTCTEDTKNKWILYPRTGSGILLIDKYTDVMEYLPLTADMSQIMKIQAQKVVAENVSKLEDGLDFLLEYVNRKGECAGGEVFDKKRANGYKIFRELVNGDSVT